MSMANRFSAECCTDTSPLVHLDLISVWMTKSIFTCPVFGWIGICINVDNQSLVLNLAQFGI